MWRYLVGACGALLLGLAGMFLFRGSAAPERMLPAMPSTAGPVATEQEAPLPDEAPSASAKTREQKRLDRYDKDRNETVTRDEYLASRHKAFAKLDTDGDGRLSFDEWSAKTVAKFTGADKDKSGSLSRAEFAATAMKRSARPRCACGPSTKPAVAKEDSDD
jgi:hypothetical protein